MSLVVIRGTSCLHLFHPFHTLASIAASSSPSMLSMSPKYQTLSTNYRLTWGHQYPHWS